MRFITEFELNTPFEIKNYKGLREKGSAEWLGLDISKAFGWNKRSEIKASGATIETHKLEIEAFPMDKWIEFKQKISNVLGHGSREEYEILHLIKELESFGKPLGETKELDK